MPILLNTRESFNDTWSPTVTPTPAGLAVDVGDLRLGNSLGHDLYRIATPLAVPCAEPGVYELALVRSESGTAYALIRDGRLPKGFEQVVYLARWTLRDGETCADVAIEVTRRVLVDRPPTVIDTPVMETYEKPVLDEAGQPRLDDEGNPITVPRERVKLDEAGEPVVTRTIVPADPLPEPTVHTVSPTLLVFEVPIAEKFAAIDARTRARIAAGFEHAGLRFSLSPEAQTKMTGAFAAREINVYPIHWNTIDDATRFEIPNANALTAFFAAGMTAVRAALDEGTAAKDAIRGAK